MGRVTWRPEAVADAEKVEAFVAVDSPNSARKLVRGIYDSTVRLADHPLSGRVVPEAADESVREVIVGNYRVMYRVWPEEVEVVAVIHGARLLDPKDLPQ